MDEPLNNPESIDQLPEFDQLTEFDDAPEFAMPIVKAQVERDGRLKVVGIATDESIDIADEIVKASRNPRCIDFINRGRAIFDLEHHSDQGGVMVGRPLKAQFITAEEARRKYPGWNYEGNCVEVAGYVNAVGDERTTPDDVKAIHHYYETGENLFMSIRSPLAGQGVEYRNGRSYKAQVPGGIYKVAITTQPICDNTPCYIAKSLNAVLNSDAEIEIEEATYDDKTPRLIVVGGLSKALSSAPAIATPGTVGGGALKLQDLQRQPGNADLSTEDDDKEPEQEKRCSHCQAVLEKMKKFCGECGHQCRSKKKQDGLSKSLEGKSLADVLAELGEALCSKEALHRREETV